MIVPVGTDSDSAVGRRHRRTLAGAAAAAGGLASLSMALLGPAAPPSAPPEPTVIHGTAGARRRLVGTPLYECHTAILGRRAYVAVVGADAELLDEARARLAELDRKWSPHTPRGELASLLTYPGVARHVSADTVLLAELDRRRPAASRSFYLDAPHDTVGLLTDEPADLTAFAAALATDLVLTDLLEAGPAGACVQIGPNTRAVGASPQHSGWLAGPARTLRVQEGAVSTAWSGESAEDAVRSATVVVDQAWRAHLLAVAALQYTDSQALAALTDAGAAALLSTHDGADLAIGAWHSYAMA